MKNLTILQKLHLSFGVLFMAAMALFVSWAFSPIFISLLIFALFIPKIQRFIGFRDRYMNPLW
jgi:hypothetical protein